MEHGHPLFVEQSEVGMTNKNDGKPWSNDDLQMLKTLITENTPPN